LSRKTRTFIAGIIRRHHRQPAGSAWRKLNPGQQALLVWFTRARKARIAEAANRVGAMLQAPWRTGKRPAQELADPPQAPLLPLARRTARQGHPRP
jgi:hypothetical protein